MQSNGGFQVLNLFREAQRQPCEPLHKRANRQVVTFNVAGAYRVLFVLVYPLPSGALSADHFAWRVRHVRVAIILDDRSELGIRSKN